MAGKADVMVVSATPREALEREWDEHELKEHVALIAGQECGSKKEHLALTAVGRYEPAHILMVGDAPGDYQAAKANGVLFYPDRPRPSRKSRGNDSSRRPCRGSSPGPTPASTWMHRSRGSRRCCRIGRRGRQVVKTGDQ